jgi:hypothetical protein
MNQSDEDILWEQSYRTLYEAWYRELAYEALSVRWQRIDVVIGIFIASTASGSVIAGLALWSISGMNIVWGAIAAIAAVGSVAHQVLGVPSRVSQQETFRSVFARLRVDMETFRQELQFRYQDSMSNDYRTLRNRLSDAISSTPSDIAFTNNVLRKVESSLQHQLHARGYLE